MKTEIECRFLECDVDSLINSLNKHNAQFVGDWLQMRYCYDFNPVRENSWIRLRTNGKTTELTIKEINSDKIDGTKESEIFVSDFNTANEILNKLGYVARSKQENRRIRYILDDVEIDIDFWPHIPTYVEFEGNNEEDILNVCKKLHLDTKKLTSLGVASIYKHYGYNLDDLKEIVLEPERKPNNNLTK